MAIITLLTDFGTSDTFIGVMKGVIWKIAPDAQIADLTHAIPPQDVRSAAYAIADAASYFPPGTVHVCVVDPGVGTQRRPMAAAIGGQYFVGPDNGLFTLVIDQAAQLTTPPVYIALNKPRFWLAKVSKSFHGRDVFAPVAAHLASGIALEEMGDPFTNPVRIPMPTPERTPRGWQGQVVGVDHFGNLVTNLTALQLPQGTGVIFHVANTTIPSLSTTFGDRLAGELIAMLDSGGHLAISVVNGSAARLLGVGLDSPVEIVFEREAGK